MYAYTPYGSIKYHLPSDVSLRVVNKWRWVLAFKEDPFFPPGPVLPAYAIVWPMLTTSPTLTGIIWEFVPQ